MNPTRYWERILSLLGYLLDYHQRNIPKRRHTQQIHDYHHARYVTWSE